MGFAKKHREKFIGAAISFVTLLVSLLFVEFALSFFLPTWGYFRFLPDDDLGFRLESSVKSMVNKFGFRDYVYPRERSQGVFRIVGLGDSQTVSCGFTDIAQAYLKILEKNLNAAANDHKQFEVLNLAVPSYNPHQYLAMLRKHGFGYSPDLVMVGFFIGNDIQAAPQDRDYIVFDGALIDREQAKQLHLQEFSPFELKLWIWMHERNIYRALQRARYAAIWAGDANGQELKFNRLTVFLSENARNPSEKLEMGKAWEDVLESFRQMQADAQYYGARMVIVAIPEEHQVNMSFRAQVMQNFKLNSADYDFEQWNRKLLSFCAETNIAYLDLMPAFVEAIKTERIYFENDTHINETGHRLTAEAIQKFLVENDLISGTPMAGHSN